MKTLLLFRHAKSSWKNPALGDHERPLNERGRKAATRMGRLINEQNFRIDVVLCSSSVRTRETAARTFAELASMPPISFRDDLYHATLDSMARSASECDPHAQCVMLIGHNPGLEQFLELLTGEATHFPTGSIAKIDLDMNDWSSLNDMTRGHLAGLWRPRELDSD